MTGERRGRVLVIDDDRVATDVIVKTLLDRGVDVSVVASPDRGIEKAAEDSPDLVFVSLFFPDSNGLKISKPRATLPPTNFHLALPWISGSRTWV